MISATLRPRDLRRLERDLKPARLRKIVHRAGSTALRDMRSEASKRVRQRKRIKAKVVRSALNLERPRRSEPISRARWTLGVTGKPVKLSAYPHRQTKRGVSVTVNKGKRTVVRSAFVTTVGAGHRGIFRRRGKARLPITELLGSRPVDALLHDGEADVVLTRGRKSFRRAFQRLVATEVVR